MAQFDNAVRTLNSTDFQGYTGNPPVDEAEYNTRKGDMFSKDAPTWSEIQAEITVQDGAVAQKVTDKASGNTKLLGLGLTQAEATAMTGYTPE